MLLKCCKANVVNESISFDNLLSIELMESSFFFFSLLETSLFIESTMQFYYELLFNFFAEVCITSAMFFALNVDKEGVVPSSSIDEALNGARMLDIDIST